MSKEPHKYIQHKSSKSVMRYFGKMRFTHMYITILYEELVDCLECTKDKLLNIIIQVALQKLTRTIQYLNIVQYYSIDDIVFVVFFVHFLYCIVFVTLGRTFHIQNQFCNQGMLHFKLVETISVVYFTFGFHYLKFKTLVYFFKTFQNLTEKNTFSVITQKLLW